MKKSYLIILSALFLLSSCFKEIDTEPIPRTVEDTFTVQNSIRQKQSYFRFYENTVLEVAVASPSGWDLAFESSGEGNKVLIGYSSNARIVRTGLYNMTQVSKTLIQELADSSELWSFDDPSYSNIADSVSLRNWEDGEVYILDRGGTDDRYYSLQFNSRTDESYSFSYAYVNSLDDIQEATIIRSEGFSFVYYSFTEKMRVEVDPLLVEWDIMTTPYSGWWESDSGVYAPFFQSGIMINNEGGVRIARIFDPEVAFTDLSIRDISNYEFTDMKGAIGANWKLLGAVGSANLYTMDPDKKYLMEKIDYESGKTLYFKLQIVDYKLDGEDHHPTIEFKYLGSASTIIIGR